MVYVSLPSLISKTRGQINSPNLRRISAIPDTSSNSRTRTFILLLDGIGGCSAIIFTLHLEHCLSFSSSKTPA